MARDMSVANELRTLYASSMGADNEYNYVFASASAEGYISSEVARPTSAAIHRSR